MSDDELRVLDEAQKLGLSVYGYDHANREFVTHVGEAVLKLVRTCGVLGTYKDVTGESNG